MWPIACALQSDGVPLNRNAINLHIHPTKVGRTKPGTIPPGIMTSRMLKAILSHMQKRRSLTCSTLTSSLCLPFVGPATCRSQFVRDVFVARGQIASCEAPSFLRGSAIALLSLFIAFRQEEYKLWNDNFAAKICPTGVAKGISDHLLPFDNCLSLTQTIREQTKQKRSVSSQNKITCAVSTGSVFRRCHSVQRKKIQS